MCAISGDVLCDGWLFSRRLLGSPCHHDGNVTEMNSHEEIKRTCSSVGPEMCKIWSNCRSDQHRHLQLNNNNLLFKKNFSFFDEYLCH